MQIPGRSRAAYTTDKVDASQHLQARTPLVSTRLQCNETDEGESTFVENPKNLNKVTFEGKIILLEGAKFSVHSPGTPCTHNLHVVSDYMAVPLSNPDNLVNENDDLITVEGVKIICIGDLLVCGAPIVSNELA